MQKAYLLLSDGTLFEGSLFGSPVTSAGEIVFNTSMTGYSEILTDPSYNGQIVLMTYPLIGNYGVDDIWNESSGIKASALVVKELYTGPLPPGRTALDKWMEKHGIPGITGVDTRALTLHLRRHGSQNAIICPAEKLEEARKTLASFPLITERDLIEGVAVKEKSYNPVLGDGFTAPPASPSHHIAVVDFGIKYSIIDNFYKRNIAITLFPPTFKAEEILTGGFDELFLSNGPGDPALLTGAISEIRKCIGRLPVCGICLGHQLITWALGGKTVKMTYGHHGANHPVRDNVTGKTFVTSQNHGFMSDMESLPENVKLWYVNANDGTVEGIYDESLHVRSVQFHPEASPGPHDAEHIFTAFIKEIPNA